MSSLVIHRPTRRPPPPVPAGDLVLASPPQTATAGGIAWWTYLFPVLGSGGAMLFALVNPQPIYLVASGLFVIGSVAMGVGMYFQQRSGQRRKLRHDREAYLAHVDQVKSTARETARLQRASELWRNPAPQRLWTVASSRTRVWERRPADDDFLEVRVGLGSQPLRTPLHLDLGSNPLAQHDAISAAAAERLVSGLGVVDGLPATVDFGRTGLLTLGGDQAAARSLARAMVCQLATFHSPEDLSLVLCVAPDRVAEWEWAKWLPHTGPAPLIASDLRQLRELIESEVEARRTDQLRRQAPPGELPGLGGVLSTAALPGDRARPSERSRAQLVLVVDGPGPAARLPELLGGSPAGIGVSVIHVGAGDELAEVDLRSRVGRDASLEMQWVSAGDGVVSAARADQAGPRLCETLARRLAPLRLSAESSTRRLVDTVPLPSLLGVADPEAIRTERTWRERPLRDRLRVPLGVGADGEPVILDLKEPALGGMGPHGLVVGATGSGKSELLRTLVTGLVLTHPPDLLSLVLVDFKGGATFAGMAELPHVAGVITNLQDDLALVDRMRDALFGEQLRRQELLRRAGNLDSVRDYQRLRASRPELEPMPFLLIIVDEFGELLTSRPDFIELFVAIGRVGRSLGMHLLLASQRLDEGRLRGLESHLSYRIALRVFSAMESRSVLGVPDAYTLPGVPGSAYLKVDAAAPQRFKVAMASVPFVGLEQASAAAESAVEPFTACSPASPEPGREPGRAVAAEGPTTIEVVVDRLRSAAPRVHQVWLPPLERALTLDRVLRDYGARGGLKVPLGLVDRPTEQAKDVLVADFEGAAGHLAIVGAPQAGKSTLLRTLLLGFALTHTPAEVQFYGIDFGGGGLQSMEELPHVGTVCGRFDPERARRVVSEMTSLLDRREQLFRAAAIDSAHTLRTLRSAGSLPKEAFGDVFLVIDNWAAVRQEFEDLEPAVLDVASRGLGYGVHLVITANRWMEIRNNLRDSIAGRLELRLNDPGDSDVDRRIAANLPVGVPGRGLTGDRLLFQAALPRLDGRPAVEDLHPVLQDLVRRMAADWQGPKAPPARVLPRRLLASELPRPDSDPRPGVPVGVAEPDLDPLYLDLTGGDPHFLVFGDGESGKTGLLRTYLAGLMARSAPDQARMVLVDYRRTLLDALHPDFLLAYAGSALAVTEAVGRLREILTSRLPDAGVSVADLRRRAWWSGPELYVVVDDYDLVVTPSASPLMSLVDFLAQGRDLGFHLVVARRAGGAGRAMFEPVLQRLKELGTPGILLSGDRQEGPLLGPHPPAPQPPGRGLLVRRRHPAALVQVAWLPPHELDAGGD